jgi:hypothetical protein
MMKKKSRSVRSAETSPTTLDQEFVIDSFGPPPPEALSNWLRAKHKRGRSSPSRRSAVISIRVEKTLLARSDALAKKKRISRARLIARGLLACLAAEGEI